VKLYTLHFITIMHAIRRQIAKSVVGKRSYHRTLLLQQANGAAATEAESSSAAQARAVARAKAAAWYLEDGGPPASEAPSQVTSTGSTDEPATSRQPRFTPYDPLSTLPQPASQVPLVPVPENLPTFLNPLHEYLTTNPLIIPHSVAIFDSYSSIAATLAQDADTFPAARGRRRRGTKEAGRGIVVDGVDVGANWDWIIVCETGARGKGAVGGWMVKAWMAESR
jgi:hypothetical protein